MQFDAAVIVVGAEPTGLMLAGELALAGVAIEVVERDLTSSGAPGGVNSRTAEVLAMRGLIDAVTERAAPRTNVGGHFAGLPVALDTRPWRTRYPGGVVLPQGRLEEMLEDHLASFGVRVRRGTELTGLDTVDGEGVTAAVCGPGGEYRLRGRYLVACDGGHSIVRKLTGVAFPGRTGTMAAVSADIELTALSATVPRAADHISRLTRKGGGYWMLLHPVAGPDDNPGSYRVVFGGPEQETLSRTAPVTADEVARALAAVHGPQTQLGRLRGGSRFSDASRQVSDYRVGRVLFAGDAAHIHSPIHPLTHWRAGSESGCPGRGEPGLEARRSRAARRSPGASGQLPHRATPRGSSGDRDDPGAERADEPVPRRRRSAGPARDRHRSGRGARRQPLPGRPDVRP
jgi:2-polyprenyl-6-methoxyphenol hydroxylase-like FAD-dependent oxidoreductase